MRKKESATYSLKFLANTNMEPFKPYVPIIRWKPAERRALERLYQKDRGGVTPLIEFIMPPPKTDAGDYRKILEDSKSKFLRNLPDVAKEITKCWGKDPVFIDVHLLDGDIRAQAFEQILSSAAGLYIFSIPVTYIIPVTSTDADAAIRNIAVKFATNDERGLCIRIDESHLKEENFPKLIEDFIGGNKLSVKKTDILVDLKIIDENKKAQLIIEQLSKIPHLEKLRSFTIAGGAFPKDLSNFKKHGHYPIKRLDWDLWKEIAESKTLKRKPNFSDYTIQHPIYYTAIPGANISASIRYANDEQWEVIRGEGLRNEKGAGFKQYPAQAQLLVQQKFYKGADFSFGDTYIAEKAKPKPDTPGSPQTWLTAGINHHITLVARQIANLP